MFWNLVLNKVKGNFDRWIYTLKVEKQDTDMYFVRIPWQSVGSQQQLPIRTMNCNTDLATSQGTQVWHWT